MAIVYKNLKTPKNVLPGMADTIWIAPLEWFDTIADVPAPEVATLATATVIAGNHTFKEGKGFLQFQCAPFTGQLPANSVGEIGSINLDKQPTVFIPGNYPELNASMEMIANQPLIILQKDSSCKDGVVNQTGCECNPAWVMAQNFQTGEGKSGRKGWALTFSSVCPSIVHYAGTITLMPEEEEEE